MSFFSQKSKDDSSVSKNSRNAEKQLSEFVAVRFCEMLFFSCVDLRRVFFVFGTCSKHPRRVIRLKVRETLRSLRYVEKKTVESAVLLCVAFFTDPQGN